MLGLSGLNLQYIVVNYVMQTVLRGCNSPLEAIVIKYSDLYCRKIKSFNTPLKLFFTVSNLANIVTNKNISCYLTQ